MTALGRKIAAAEAADWSAASLDSAATAASAGED